MIALGLVVAADADEFRDPDTRALVDGASAGTYRRRNRGSAPQTSAAHSSSGFTPMARRRATNASGKSVSATARAPRVKPKNGPAGVAMTDRLAAVERERDALKDELERSKSRLRLLEETQSQVRDRIAWALDSLHSILQGKG